MGEIIARIGPSNTVELADERSVPIIGTQPLTPETAAFLGRELISCAVALSSTNPPKVGDMPSYALIPIVEWVVVRFRLPAAQL
jgi:hypothetical protein